MSLRTFVFSIILASLFVNAPAICGEKKQTFPAKAGDTLVLRTDQGNVTIRGAAKNEVAVSVRSGSDEQLKNVRMSQSGGTITVEYHSRERHQEEMDFDVSIPSTFDLEVQTAGGDLKFIGQISGKLEGSTAGGDIRMTNLGGDIRMETAGGDIEAGKIAGDLQAQTAGGDIAVEGGSGAFELSTAGGNITVGDVGKTLRVSTAGGDVTIGKVSGNLEVSTAGGDIKVKSAQGTIEMRTAGGNISIVSAKGKVTAETSAGDLSLESIQGSVNARSSAGNIDVALEPSPGESSVLSTSAGDIVLKIGEGAKASISARSRGPFMGDEGGDSGMIRSDFPVVRAPGSRGRAEARIDLNGGGHKISLEAMIGAIEVRKLK